MFKTKAAIVIILTAFSVFAVLQMVPSFAYDAENGPRNLTCQHLKGGWSTAPRGEYIYTVDCGQNGKIQVVKWLSTEPVAIYDIEALNKMSTLKVSFSKFDDEPIGIRVENRNTLILLFELESGLISESYLSKLFDAAY